MLFRLIVFLNFLRDEMYHDVEDDGWDDLLYLESELTGKIRQQAKEVPLGERLERKQRVRELTKKGLRVGSDVNGDIRSWLDY